MSNDNDRSLEAFERLAEVAWQRGIKSAAPFVGQGLHFDAIECVDHMHYFLFECREQFADVNVIQGVDRLFKLKDELSKKMVPVTDGESGEVIGFMPGVVYS